MLLRTIQAAIYTLETDKNISLITGIIKYDSEIKVIFIVMKLKYRIVPEIEQRPKSILVIKIKIKLSLGTACGNKALWCSQ